MNYTYQIGVIEGDGIGPEIVNETLKILHAVEKRLGEIKFDFIPLPAGLQSFNIHGSTLPTETIEGLKKCHAGILGPMTTHIYNVQDENMLNPNSKLRKIFDLYANIRPAKNFSGVETRFEKVDMVIVRENTEGMYADRNLFQGSGEFMPDPDTVLSLRVVRRSSSERIARVGFELAAKRKKAVALVHKKNVLRQGCGLFLESSNQVGAKYKDIAVEEHHIDAFSMYMVQNPENYDVIVTTNMFGDILSDLAAGLVGGLGLAPGLNLGDDFMLAQATHGSAPDIAGENIANPVAEILSAKMMLEWLGIRHDDDIAFKAARIVEQAVENTIAKGIKTVDLGGDTSTTEFGDEVVHALVAIDV